MILSAQDTQNEFEGSVHISLAQQYSLPGAVPLQSDLQLRLI